MKDFSVGNSDQMRRTRRALGSALDVATDVSQPPVRRVDAARSLAQASKVLHEMLDEHAKKKIREEVRASVAWTDGLAEKVGDA